MDWVYLAIAILAEIIATSALKASGGFTRLWPSAVTALCYAVAFFFLSLTLATIPIGIAYAIWSGVGIILISAIGLFLFDQSLDFPAVFGITLILCGVLVINLFSKSAVH